MGPTLVYTSTSIWLSSQLYILEHCSSRLGNRRVVEDEQQALGHPQSPLSAGYDEHADDRSDGAERQADGTAA